MKEKPIIMTGESIPAILADIKTQTRRVVIPANPFKASRMGGYQQGRGLWINRVDNSIKDYSISPCWMSLEGYTAKYAPYRVGDILWVRETWKPSPCEDGVYAYKADGLPEPAGCQYLNWRSPIFMPRKAARILLLVTDVRIERLEDISEEYAIAEGANWVDGRNVGVDEKMRQPARERYFIRWDALNGKRKGGIYAIERNPWVWAITFERIAEENAMEQDKRLCQTCRYHYEDAVCVNPDSDDCTEITVDDHACDAWEGETE